MTAGVYAIINTVTGGRYIGSTRDFETRQRSHQVGLRTFGNHPNTRLLAAIREHGADAFVVELVEEVTLDDDELEAAERRWLEYFAVLDRDLLYNTDLTGRRPRWLHAGKLRGTKLPGRGGWRVPVEEVERMERGE